MSGLVVHRIRTEILRLGDGTKTEISQAVGISFPTVSKIIDQLEADQEVCLVGTDKSSGGRRAQRYSLNPEYRQGIALYIERQEAVYTVLNYTGDVLERKKVRMDWQEGPDTLTELVREIRLRHPKVTALSLGVPGAVKNGTTFHIPHFPAYHNFDIKRYYEEKLAIAVDVENDMNAAVLGYHETHAKADNPTLVYVFLGTNGPGAGILINGDVVRGSSFFSGEISYVPQYDGMSFLKASKRDNTEAGKPALSGGQPLVIDSLARLVATLVAIINPHAVIFCKEDLDGAAVREMGAVCSQYVPAEHVPRLVLRDREQDYLEGLRSIALGRMLKDL